MRDVTAERSHLQDNHQGGFLDHTLLAGRAQPKAIFREEPAMRTKLPSLGDSLLEETIIY